MERDITRLSKKKYDVLIIGAGIYGAATAWDAASRGLSVALLDKNDFGSKTSFNSQKIIHGGLRYLQHGDFKRVRESACERTSLMRIAPHLVHPMPCLIPIYGQTMRFIMPLALKTFDLFSYDRNTLKDPQKHIPNSRIVSKAECMQLIPGLMEDGLTGGSIWYDAQAYNTERLVLSFIRSAEKAGADVAN
ncbi:MAG: glycerol-3-phosphate dehydrogenase, partial [Candidatus Methanomarinus sp.]